MASGSKTTAVHFTLIFFVMLSVILGVVSYMYYDEDKTLRATADEAKAQSQLDATALRKSLEDLGAIKQLTGYRQANIGDRNNPAEGTLSKAIKNDLQKYGGSLAKGDLAATIQILSQQVDTATKERDTLMAELQKHKNQNASQRNQYDVQVKAQTTATQMAEKDRAQEQSNREEAVAQKNQEIDDLRNNISKVQLEIEQLRDDQANEVIKLNQTISLLRDINNKHVAELEIIKRNSFEQQDGLIRWVDNVNGIVWINLGKADYLPKRMTFSVYTKDNEGIGRGTHDIKGSIEVTRLLGAHLAECKVVDDDVHNPIAPGDPIYTPLWSLGVKHRFSFVGWIDLDGDKKYELDRKQLHHIIASSGAEVGGEVDNEGNFTGTEIDVNTKFLVVGHIPSPGDFTDPEEQEQATAIVEHLKSMREQARERGVRVINLNDFIAYMGYKPSRRLWLPGEDVPWLLKSGSRSTAVNEAIGSRQSSGTTSGVYTRSKRLKQPISPNLYK